MRILINHCVDVLSWRGKVRATRIFARADRIHVESLSRMAI